MRKTILSREAGFTLLEVVFAVGILAIGIMGYTSLKISNRYSWVFAKDLTQAVPFTAAQLEGLLLGGYESAEMGGANLSGEPTKTYTRTLTAAEYLVNSGGDVLGAGDLPVGGKNWATWRGVNSSSSSERTFVDFAPSEVGWTVYGECPSELCKMVVFDSKWGSGGSRAMDITQIQVRQ